MTLPPSTGEPSPPVEIAAAVVQQGDEVLIGLRGDGVPLAGYWEFPGGKVQEGEPASDAARRECWEETGVAVRIVEPYPVVDYQYPHGSLRIHFFAAKPLGERGAVPDRFRWVKRADLSTYLFPPANAEVLRILTSGTPSSQPHAVK